MLKRWQEQDAAQPNPIKGYGEEKAKEEGWAMLQGEMRPGCLLSAMMILTMTMMSRLCIFVLSSSSSFFFFFDFLLFVIAVFFFFIIFFFRLLSLRIGRLGDGRVKDLAEACGGCGKVMVLVFVSCCLYKTGDGIAADSVGGSNKNVL